MVNKHCWLPWIIAAVSIAAILLICLALAAQAAPSYQATEQVPGIVSYQGQVDIAGVPFSGTGYFRFAIIDSEGTFYWSNDGSPITPTEAITLPVVNGLFNVILGETNPITYGMFLDSDRLLRVWFDDGTHGIQLLEPDTRITSALFAFRADESMTAITSTYATTATWSFGSITSTIATTASYALWANIANYATYADEAGRSYGLLDAGKHWFAHNFVRIGGNSYGPVKPDTIAQNQIPYWEVVTAYTVFTHTSVLTSSPNLVFDGSTMTATNVTVSGVFSATVLTATYATEALTSTNLVASPSVRVYNSSAITVPHNTWITLTFNSERWDASAMHDTVNTSRLTAPMTGVYLIDCLALFAPNATGLRNTHIVINGAGEFTGGTHVVVDGTNAFLSIRTPLHISTVYQLSAGDYAECFVYQTSGINLTVDSVSNDSPEFLMVKLP